MMQLSKSSRTSDYFGRYYTESAIAQLLVEAMQLRSPKKAIDLGAGSGALAGEAYRQWSGTEFITVDIDQAAASAYLPKLHGSTFTHHTADALSESLDIELGIYPGEIDCGLCNPPYIRPRWSKHFGEILEEAGLSQVFPKLGNVPADILFIAQNLRLLGKGGKLGLILSDGLIAGEKHTELRKLLASCHKIERVIELPRRVFRKTDAKAHIVVLSKGTLADRNIQIQKLWENGLLSESISIDPDQARHRLDYSYFEVKNRNFGKKNKRPLKNYGVFIKRGGYSSSQIKTLLFPVFHTTDFDHSSEEVPSRFLLNEIERQTVDRLIAIPGDILVARVGRNLDEKLCYVNKGYVAISDCVFVIRTKRENRKIIFDFISSKAGKTALRSIAHGVGANFITVDSLLRLEI